jgi:hypothetical protein
MMVVPYGALTDQTGGSTAIPIVDFGLFYVTDWGPSSNKNTCSNTGLPEGEIDGYFVSPLVQAPTDPNDLCDPRQLRPCLPSLVY